MAHEFKVGDAVMYIGAPLEYAKPGDCGEVIQKIPAGIDFSVSEGGGEETFYIANEDCLVVKVFSGKVIAGEKRFIPLKGDSQELKNKSKEAEPCA